jgi:hypothetical protein
MAQVIIELIDDAAQPGAVQLKLSHGDIPTHDENGNPLPPTPAMLAAVSLIQHFKTGGTGVANDTTGPVIDALSPQAGRKSGRHSKA